MENKRLENVGETVKGSNCATREYLNNILRTFVDKMNQSRIEVADIKIESISKRTAENEKVLNELSKLLDIAEENKFIK